MYIKSNIFEFIVVCTFLGLLLFSYKIANFKLTIVLVIFALCYDIFVVITKEKYKTKWFIVMIDVILIVITFIFAYFYMHPISASDNSEFFKRIVLEDKIKIALSIVILLNAALKMDKFKV